MSHEILAPALKVSLRQWLTSRRWFAGKARAVVRIHPADMLPLPLPGAGLMLLQVEYTFGPAELYQLMFVLRQGEAAERLAAAFPDSVVHRFERGSDEPAVVMAEALADREFAAGLLELMSGSRKFGGPAELPDVLRGIGRPGGMVAAASVPELGQIIKASKGDLDPEPITADQSNSCVVYGQKLFLKLFRKLAPGINPELEIGRFLAASGLFPNTPALCGSLEYKSVQADTEPLTLGVLQQFTPGKSAWQTTLDSLQAYLDRMAAIPQREWPRAANAFEANRRTTRETASEPQGATGSLWALASQKPIEAAEQLAGDDLRKLSLLGRRTAELHLALAADADDPRFAPEPFTEKQQQTLRWSMRDLASRTCELLRQRLAQLSAETQATAKEFLVQENRLLGRFDEIVVEPIEGQRIRVHGDYHLGQVIDLGDDFMIIDFEGEPARSLEERRMKRSPLFDVAGMIRSLHYVASQALALRMQSSEPVSPNQQLDKNAARDAADCWYSWAVSAFLGAYRTAASTGSFLPRSTSLCDRLLALFVLEKAVYELAYELNNRPDWVAVPLAGLLELLGPPR
jgi:maltose alpha-D-glucosyltransferase/alpha-amylase